MVSITRPHLRAMTRLWESTVKTSNLRLATSTDWLISMVGAKDSIVFIMERGEQDFLIFTLNVGLGVMAGDIVEIKKLLLYLKIFDLELS